jgi:AraC-like DNA-binding protein
MLGISLFAGYHGLIQKDIKKEPFTMMNSSGSIIETDEINSPEYDIKTEGADGKDETALEKIYSVIKEILPDEAGMLSPAEKYSGSALSEEPRRQLIVKLEILMESDKIFISDNLTIEEVALKLGTRTKYVSQIINENYKKNFYNFINTYRVEEAMRLLLEADNEKYSILGIAQMVGFVSKSTFNAAFKRVAGTTPSEYRRKNSTLSD